MVEIIRTPETKLIQRLAEMETQAFEGGGLNEWTFVPYYSPWIGFLHQIAGRSCRGSGIHERLGATFHSILNRNIN